MQFVIDRVLPPYERHALPLAVAVCGDPIAVVSRKGRAGRRSGDCPRKRAPHRQELTVSVVDAEPKEGVELLIVGVVGIVVLAGLIAVWLVSIAVLGLRRSFVLRSAAG